MNYVKVKTIQGFSLIEVLVASLLIMLGVTGYVSLQTEYVVADKNLNLHYGAIQLAQQKVEDLLLYQELYISEGKYAYQDISSNAGGSITAGIKTVRMSKNASDTHKYMLTWQVVDWFYVDSDFDQISDAWVSTGHKLFPSKKSNLADAKSVKVQISWDNTEGQAQSISINSYIVSISPSASFHAKYRALSANSVP